MKYLKKFFILILTMLLTIILFILGISLNLKYTITDTLGKVVKEEITDNIVDTISQNSEMSEEEIRTEINKVLEDNPTINKTMEDCFDKAMDILNGKDVKDLDLKNEIETIINENEAALKEYGINITEEDKQQILGYVSSEEFNGEFNNFVTDFKQDIPAQTLTILNIFNIIISKTFKIILICLLVVLIILIAVLKKSLYKWLSNFSVATIINGILYSTVFILLEELLKNNNDINITLSSFKLYGFIMLSIGILSIILNLILKKINKTQIEEKQNNN